MIIKTFVSIRIKFYKTKYGSHNVQVSINSVTYTKRVLELHLCTGRATGYRLQLQ